jgi:uncharacterized protein (TIGR02145 family)
MIRISMNLLKRYGRTLLAAAVVAAAVGAVGLLGCGGDKSTDSGEEKKPGTGTEDPGTTDPGSKEIKAVTIGGKVWMAENLNVEVGNSWCFRNDSAFCELYGKLYDWQTAATACPEGWRLPADRDWDDLVAAAGGAAAAGTKLKSGRNWASGGGGTDSLGFSALPGGQRLEDGDFRNQLSDGYWWTATEDSDNRYAFYRSMSYNDAGVAKNDERKGRGFSVRCVKK